MSDSFTAEQFGLRTRDEYGRVDLEVAAAEFSLSEDVLDGTTLEQPDQG